MDNEEKYKKDIHHIHDKSYKDLYSKKEIAIDLLKTLSNHEWVKARATSVLRTSEVPPGKTKITK